MNVIFTFYRNFIWPALLATLISCNILLYGSSKDIVYLFWMKLICNIFLGVYFEFFRAQQFCFFNNLGYSKTTLYIGATILDLSVWTLLTICIQLI